MNLTEFKTQIRKRLKDAPDPNAPRWFRNIMGQLVAVGDISHVEDFCGAQIAGSTAAALHTANNGPLLDEMFAHFLWHRLHRGAFWVRKFEDVYAPSSRLIESLKRMIEYGELCANLHPGVLSHMKAALCFVRQDFAEADALVRNSPYPSYAFMSSFMLGSRTFRDAHTELDLASIGTQGEELISWGDLGVIDRWKDQECRVLVFSCDEAYFLQFASHAISTALRLIPNVRIAIGLVSSEDGKSQVGIGDLAWPDGKPLNLNSKVAVIEGRTSYELRPMTALGRFFLARSIHSILDCGCFIFDIDIEFLPEMVESILKIMDDGDFGLSHNVYGRAAFPWSKVTAASVHVPEGNRGQFIYDIYLSYVSKVLGERNWWVDQNALFASYSMYKTYFPCAGISNTHKMLAKGIAMTSDPAVRSFKAEANRNMRSK